MVGRVAVAAAGAVAFRRATGWRWVRRLDAPTTTTAAVRGRGTVARRRQRAGEQEAGGGGEEQENGN